MINEIHSVTTLKILKTLDLSHTHLKKDIKSRFGIHQLGAIINDPILYLFETH